MKSISSAPFDNVDVRRFLEERGRFLREVEAERDPRRRVALIVRDWLRTDRGDSIFASRREAAAP
jgi:hypothetical protein